MPPSPVANESIAAAGPDPVFSPPAESAPLGDAFSALENYLGEGDAAPADGGRPAAAVAAEPKPASTPAAPADKPKPAVPAKQDPKLEAKAPAKDPDKEPAAPKPAPDKDDELPVEDMSPKALRKAYQSLKAKARELEERVAQQKEASPADDPEKKELAEKLAERDKRLSDYEEERRFTNYEASEEYKQRYYEPFVEAFAVGRDKVSKMTVTVDGEERQGTDADFDAVMRVQDENEAAELAYDMFGNKAAAVLVHREKVIEMNNARVKAINDYRKNGSEREKQQAASRQKEIEGLKHTFESQKKAAIEKFPHWFKPTEGEGLDPKANELLQKGMEMVDKAYEGNNLPPQELAKLHSAIRNKAGAFDRVAYELRQAKKVNAELKAKLAEFEESVPGGGAHRKAAAAPAETNWEARLDALASPS